MTVSSVRANPSSDLLRQPVDQVHVHRQHAVGAAGVDDRQRLFDALDAIDRLLHLRVEVLHAQAGPVEAGLGQLANVVRGKEARIQLDRDVAVVGLAEAEMPLQRIDRLVQLRGRQEVRRAAAEVQLDHFAVAVEHGRREFDLTVQPGQVDFAARQVARDHAVAAAVEARARAERHVDVQRQAARDRIPVAHLRGLAQLRLAEGLRELGRRRVGRVTRTRAVVAPQQFGVKGGVRIHGDQPIARKSATP